MPPVCRRLLYSESMRPVLSLALILAAAAALAQDPRSPDPKVRIRAARELAKQGSEAILKLQPLLKDPVVDVRVEAVKAIIEIGGIRTLNPLIEATRDNDAEIQIRATDGLVNFFLPGYAKTGGGLTASIKRAGDALKARFTDTNDQVIDAFLDVRPEVVAAIGKLASSSPSLDARANAARAIGTLRGRAALPDLYEALRSKDSRLIYESLIAIQKIRDPSAGPRVTFLLRDFDEKVQTTAIETVGLMRTKEALPDLRRVLDEARDAKVRRAALSAIAQIPDEGNRKSFVAFLGDKDDGLRAAAAEGLGRLKNPSDRPLLDKAFNEERRMNARLALAFALVNLGSRDTSEFAPLTYLVNSLASKSWRGVASAYLVELTRDPAVRQTLYRWAPNWSRDEKIEVARILAQSGDKDSLPLLEGLAKDGDSAVAQEGLRALRSVKARHP